MERSNRIGWAQVRGGVFILIALVFFAGGVLLMGEKNKMFLTKGKLRVVMDDVAGLKEGAPVWLAGVDVGVVKGIEFADPRKSNEVGISLEVDQKALHKIGPDSRITVKTRGLMGEKYVDITPSQQYFDTPPAVLRGTTLLKLDDVFQKAGATFDRLNTVADSITRGQGTLGRLTTDPGLYQNIVRLTGELNALTVTINRGEGSLGKLARSPEPYDRLVTILNRADRTLQDIQASNGTLNKLIYDTSLYDKLTALAEKSNQAADDVRELNRKIASREGSLGLLINDREFYDKGVSLLARADSSIKSLEAIAGKVDRGEGTAGRLINERDLYERLNRMVEDVDTLLRDFREHPRKYINFSLF